LKKELSWHSLWKHRPLRQISRRKQTSFGITVARFVGREHANRRLRRIELVQYDGLTRQSA